MFSLQDAFDEQVNNLLAKDYPKLANKDRDTWLELVSPLRLHLPDEEFVYDQETGKLSFVIVVKSSLISVVQMIGAVEYREKVGFEKLYPHVPEDYLPIAELDLPQPDIYLLMDIDRGKETLNIAPNKALEIIQSQSRSPLTIDEGIAIVTHYPEFLQKNNCFSMLGSRTTDKTVPAIWISENRPKLGWCWNGNPHTWLGSASCTQRLA